MLSRFLALRPGVFPEERAHMGAPVRPSPPQRAPSLDPQLLHTRRHPLVLPP